MQTTLLHGDCLEVLPTLDAESVDACVTDPPYGLSFMGKDWDHGVPGEHFWREVSRVLKPGAHLFAFGGTRTFHRLTCAIEDAGFEIRDCLSWLYGSGFPKSLDVSKAIDKVNGETNRLHRFTAWMRSTGLTARQLDEVTGTNMGGHYLTAASQPAIPTVALWGLIRPLCGEVPKWVDALVDRVEAEREKIGEDTKARSGNGSSALPTCGSSVEYKTWDITAPATDLARQWTGWGTALKPAWEPIILARKPLIGTVAANVEQYGTGAVNVDGCRIATDENRARMNHGRDGGSSYVVQREDKFIDPGGSGRWPANLILDETIEGEWTRFFYTAKASRSERNAGLEGMRPVVGKRTQDGGDDSRGRPLPVNQNHHPTVKPIALMCYLCRVITPPGGTVLDPFTGSGSTGCGAVQEGFDFTGIEREAEYLEIARRRIEHWQERADHATAQGVLI